MPAQYYFEVDLLQEQRLVIQYRYPKRYRSVDEWLLLLLPPEGVEGSCRILRSVLKRGKISSHRFGGPRFLGW